MERNRRTRGLWLVLAVGLALVACNDESKIGIDAGTQDAGPQDAGTPDAGPGEAIITIQNFTFSPDNLTVSPGMTVRVQNMDTVPHSVTSESAPGNFVPGEVNGVSFDTGAFTGERTFTIPANAPSGTVIPYFCTVHTSGMRNSPQITVQ